MDKKTKKRNEYKEVNFIVIEDGKYKIYQKKYENIDGKIKSKEMLFDDNNKLFNNNDNNNLFQKFIKDSNIKFLQ